jgi:transposase InsO family protein
MPWENRTVKEQREGFVEAATHQSNFSAVCREYGITRKTGYKWLERYLCGEDLVDRSREPHRIPHKTPPNVEKAILRVRADNPGWGARTIHQVLKNEGVPGLPSARTVNAVLNRYGCIEEEESQKRKAYLRYEKEACNEMWQTDFKGEFKTKDGKYCYPLDILDDHSRFAIKIAASDTTANIVIPCFKAAFLEYGLPKAILSDNGAQFAGFRNGYTQFEKWLMCLGILPVHGRIKHPQTQGKIERFHRSMKNEFLKYHDFEDAAHAHDALQDWRDKYNFVRPHEALGMRTPGAVYVPSDRCFPARIQPWEYDGRYHVIKVNSWGYVRFDRFQVYLSETMIDEHVEFRPNPHGDSFAVCFRNFQIAEYSTENGKLLNRSISRL